MPTFSVTRKVDQVEIYRYEAAEATPWRGMEFETHDHTEIVVAPPPPPPVTPVRITKLAFRSRFTQAEKVAIEIAALDNPEASMPARAQAAALRSSQADVAVAQFIDLTRADTRAGVQVLEAVGLLAAGRAAVILDTPPAEHEVWNG